MTLSQIHVYAQELNDIDEWEDFDTILHSNLERAQTIVEKLYASQEARIKRCTREAFEFMEQGGRLD